MSRGVKYSVGEKKVMTSLVRHAGLTGARNILQRMANVSLVTLSKLADQADIKLNRGRPGADGVVVAPKVKTRKLKNSNRSRRFTDEQRKEFIELIKVNGLTGTQNILAERGIQITLTTLQKLGKLASIKLHRGRPALVKQEATSEVAAA